MAFAVVIKNAPHAIHDCKTAITSIIQAFVSVVVLITVAIPAKRTVPSIPSNIYCLAILIG